MLYKFDKEKLCYTNVSNRFLLIFISITLIFVSLIVLIVMNDVKKIKYLATETNTIVLNDRDDFSRENFIKYLEELNIKFPDIVLAQAEIETGNFTSKVFKENNNLFGMKVATQRPTTNSGESLNHAYYKHWKESVLDYALFTSVYLRNIKSEKEFLNYLKENYSEDSLYCDKILQKIKQ